MPWQLGDTVGTADVWVSDDVSWYVERQFGAYGTLTDGVFHTDYAVPRLLISWALGLREHARIEGPAELVDEARERIDRIIELHRGDPRHRAGRPAARGRRGRRATAAAAAMPPARSALSASPGSSRSRRC